MVRPRFVCLALVLATLMLYLPVRHHGFLLYDDPEYITENSYVQAGLSARGFIWTLTTFHASNWHPLTWWSHMLDCSLFGLDSAAHHVVNVLIHAGNAALLFLVVLRLTRGMWVAGFVAALFAWHPLHVQSVAWAAERKDLLSTFFGLLAIAAYLYWVEVRGAPPASAAELRKGPDSRARMRSRGRYALVAVCFALSLMAKPMLVTLPFVLLLMDYWPLGRLRLSPPTGIPNRPDSTESPRLQREPRDRIENGAPHPGPLPFRRGEGESSPGFSVVRAADSSVSLVEAIVEKLPLFALTALSCVVTYLAQRSEAVIALESHALGARLANAVVSYGGYLWKMFWPIDLAVIYPLPRSQNTGMLVSASAALFGISALCWRERFRRPHLLTGWLWYLGMLVPVIGLVQVGGQAMADRYTYVPLVGIFLAITVEARQWASRWKAPVWGVSALAGLILVLLAAITFWQLQFWRDSEALFGRALAVTRGNAIAEVNYGMALELGGRPEPAKGHYLEALRFNPSLAQAHNNLANLLDAEGNTAGAVDHYEAALKLKPGAALTHANLARVLGSMGRLDEARQHYAEAIRLAPEDPRPYYLRGKTLLTQGASAEAVRSFEEALRRDVNHLQSLTYLARVLASDYDPAVRNGARAVQAAERAALLTDYQHPMVLETLATAYAEHGEFPKALETIRLAISSSEKAGDSAAADQMRQRLKAFQGNQPWREGFTNTPTPFPAVR